MKFITSSETRNYYLTDTSIAMMSCAITRYAARPRTNLPPLQHPLHPRNEVQRFTIRWALGCEKFLPSPAWLLLSKTGPLFSASL